MLHFASNIILPHNIVVPRKGHKGHIVKKILEDVRARSGDVDFVLCMGDDIADEKMFTVSFARLMLIHLNPR